jgi:RHS repeat-associated protein
MLLASMDADGSQLFYISDAYGSPAVTLDEASTAVVLPARSVFGETNTGEAVNAFGFTGHAEDSTGLVWGKARYYEPSNGVWLAEDPVMTELRYAYAGNSPLAFVDPDGRSMFPGRAKMQRWSCVASAYGAVGINATVFGSLSGVVVEKAAEVDSALGVLALGGALAKAYQALDKQMKEKLEKAIEKCWDDYVTRVAP